MADNMDDVSTTVQALKEAVRRFTAERGWHPDARSLAISISIEAAELLEHFQWHRYARQDDREAIRQELADVLIYCLQFAMELEIDVVAAVADKLARNADKYPAALFANEEDGASNYYAAKDAARRGKLDEG
jgi:NTP pyrophosphatase (non-canonical NTP hydrolase)